MWGPPSWGPPGDHPVARWANPPLTGFHGIDYDTVNLLLKTIDTEYDKNVLRTVLALSLCLCTRPELYDLGIDPTSANRHIRAKQKQLLNTKMP